MKILVACEESQAVTIELRKLGHEAYSCDIIDCSGGHPEWHICTGVRWEESASRKNGRGIYEKNGDKKHRIILNNDNDDRRMLFENCRLKSKRTVNPIIDWKKDDVWDFLSDVKSPINPLYSEGWSRVGCVGCPLAGKKTQMQEFLRWPKYEQLYLNAFDRMLKERVRRATDGNEMSWQTAKDVMNWFLSNGVLPGQVDLFDDFLEEEDE